MSEECVIELPEQFTIASVMMISEKMFEAMKSETDIVKIDGSKVERADTAAIQLLCSFAKTANESHIQLGYEKPSEALRNSIDMLGLGDSL